LGQGLGVAIGCALNAKLEKKDYRVYTILGDGELDEGSVWEAVMCVNHPVMDENSNPIIVICGEYKLDELMSAFAANYIVKEAAGREVKVAQILGDIRQTNAFERDETFKKIIAKHPNIKYVNHRVTDWTPEPAMKATEDFIAADPDLFAIYLQTDGFLPGDFAALKQKGMLYKVGDPKHIILACTTDGTPVGLQAIRDGLCDMTAEHSPYIQAAIVTKAALMVAQGIKLPEIGKEGVITPDIWEINIENVDDPSLWGNYGPPCDEIWPGTLEVWEKYRWAGDEVILNSFK